MTLITLLAHCFLLFPTTPTDNQYTFVTFPNEPAIFEFCNAPINSCGTVLFNNKEAFHKFIENTKLSQAPITYINCPSQKTNQQCQELSKNRANHIKKTPQKKQN